MANEHPFQMLFETLGRVPLAHADSVNRQAYELLYDILSVPVEKAGRCILLRAPRAGHGKTHLLSRIQHHLGASHEFIPLHPAFGCQIDAASVIDDSLRRLLRPLPASGGLCVLDLVTRRLFATALQPLVGSGEVPCQDREGALTALRTRPIETFDFHHPNAVTAHWARENFEVLGQRLSVELAQRCGLPIREVSFWVDALFRFAATPVENPIRLRVLADVVHAGEPGEGVLMERLEALLGMLAQLMRVVLVADDLEGFSTDESAALRLAAFLGSIRQSVERLDVILSLNQDIWQSAFVPRLSGGLTDRLSEVVVELSPLTEDEMVALLESRVPGLGSRVLSKVDKDSAGTHARGLIRAAGVAWLRASAQDTQAPIIPPPLVPAVAAASADPEMDSSPVPPPVPVLETIVSSSDEVVSETLTTPPVDTPAEPIPAPNPAPEPEIAPETVDLAPEKPVFAPENVIAPVQAIAPEPATAPIERAPDPTLAISFLAAEAAAAGSSWPAPEVAADVSATSVKASEETPVFEAAPPAIGSSGFSAEPAAASVFEPAPSPTASFEPQPPSQPAPVFEASPFQVAAAQEFQPAPPVWQPAVEAAPAFFTPAAPEISAPAFEPAPTFQAAPEPSVSAPQPVWQPAVEAAPASFTPAAPEVSAPVFEPAPAFKAAPEPSVSAPQPVWNPAPQQPVWEPAPQPVSQASPQPVWEPAPQSASQPAWEPAPQPAPQPTPQPAWEPAPQAAFQAVPEPTPAPAFEPAPAFQAAPEPPAAAVFEAAPPMQDAAAQQSVPDTDRVDDLLRQFRERYGRGSL